MINTSDDEVVVYDYDGRPYLRIGPDGVFENQNSPAVYLNQSSDAPVLVPDGVGDGPPDWTRVSGEPSYRWHDHRFHWMGGDPPLVTAQPDVRQTVAEWTVPLGTGERRRRSGHHRNGCLRLRRCCGSPLRRAPGRRRRRVGSDPTCERCHRGGDDRYRDVVGQQVAVGSWHATAEATIGKLPMLALPFLILTLLAGALSIARPRTNDALILPQEREPPQRSPRCSPAATGSPAHNFPPSSHPQSPVLRCPSRSEPEPDS